MDANTIRLILIVVGALLVLALFLWERSRRDGDADDDDDYEEADAPYGLSSGKREPRLGRGVDEARGNDPDQARPGRSPATPSRRLDPESEAESDPDEALDADMPADMEPLLIQLSVSARREPFAGPELMDAADICGLRPGRMDIFHCLDEFDHDTRIYFSMANMVKPGTFPFEGMEDFSTPGLMLFAQLDGRPEDITILEELIATARKLASELDGEVLDETRRPLTVRKEEDLRQAVLDNERRWARTAER
ncbi:MAG: cell division protein ZipA C-terminal FtsZ-binding domain-containing protein [Thiocapsa sp.]|uniref:cell division protein ZipA C-terminal FtsZ-binding domain-containing protein n=1 Tax=Thiocapsa sp. TaxID=2024551 RepID=UPI001BD05EF0|nr:cell division protein ZipA C-terminal FtsZ-binding domain-containing protein [Thiocapsa sp.]QVL48584.1 MAG: cell division protein ZipA C-terminal FtsZ-binding domain-containing protein [Thiocapsa sp.]